MLSTDASLRPELLADFPAHVQHISRHSLVFLLGTLFTAGAGYLFKIYLARTLGAEALGIYTLGMTVGGLAAVVAALGLPQTASRFVAVYASTGQSQKLGRFLCVSLAILAVTSLLVGFAMIAGKRWIASSLYHTPVLARYMNFFAAIMVLGAFTTFLGQSLAGYKDVARRTVITNFIGTPATMAFSVALLSLGLGLWGYLAAQVASSVLVLVLLVTATWKLTPVPARVPWLAPSSRHSQLLARPILEPEVVSFATILLGVQALEFVAGQADRIMLGIYVNAREVGVYSVAASLVTFVSLFLQAINQMFAPTIAELHAKGERQLLLLLYQTLTKWVLGLTIPLALVIMIFSMPLMNIFGADFRRGWPVLVIATAGQLVNCSVGSAGLLLLMSDQQQKMIRAQAISVCVALSLNYLLIPQWGIVGAAVASAATSACLNLLWLREVRRVSLSPSRRSYLTFLVPAALTIIVLVILRVSVGSRLPDFLSVVLGLCTGYTAFVLSSLRFALEPHDRLLARSFYSRLRGSLTT